jgi:hypothetical protein
MSANTAARPLWIIEPKIAENTPRSADVEPARVHLD